ncbi:MAG TPA: Ig-like domain-containing protein, partial [Isosphaeraceae bacterium]|nr:Ig-like domain-containing protein [Isosphaeraceae bacterium]
PGAGTPTGTVTFLNGSTTLGTGTTATVGGVTTATLVIGSYPGGPLTASYAGDVDDQASVSEPLTVLTVTSTKLTLSASEAVVNQPETLTATFGVPGLSGPFPAPGTVDFLDGTTVIGTGSLAIVGGVDEATFTTSALALGSHSLTASYLGSPIYASSASAATVLPVVQDGTNTVLTMSGAALVRGESVTLTAIELVASPGAGTATGSVTFMDGTTALGTVPLAVVGLHDQATFTTSSLAPGAHPITAVYSGDADDAASNSDTLVLTVGPDATTSDAYPSTSTPVRGQAMTLYDVVTADAPGAGTPTGTVTFKYGSTVWATVPLMTAGGKTWASMATAPMPLGTFTVTTLYSGDAGDLPSTGSMTFTVAKDATTTVVIPSDLAPVRGESLAINAFVSIASPGAGTPTGTVTFKNCGAVVAVEPLVTYRGYTYATLPTPPMGLGTYAITAVYNGDAGAAASTGATNLVVGRDATVAIGAALTPTAALGHPTTLVAAVDVVAPGAGTATGSVTFMEGTTVLGTGSLAVIGGTPFAAFTTSSLSAGVHRITADYGGDAWDRPSTSAPFTVTIAGGSSPAATPAGPAIAPAAAARAIPQATAPAKVTVAPVPAAAVAPAGTAQGQAAWLAALEALADEGARPIGGLD